MNARLQRLAAASAVLAAGIAVWFAPGRIPAWAADAGKEAPAGKTPPQSVEVVKPQRETMARALNVPATIEAFETTDLYAKTSGYIAEVRADIGDRVKAGQVLAVIDAPEMTKDLEEAKARLSVKQSLLSVASGAAMKTADANIVQAQKKVDVARHQFELAAVALTLNDKTSQRREKLFTEGAVTEQDLDEVRARLATARAEAAIAQARIAAAESDLLVAREARAAAEAQVEVAKSEVTLARAQVEKANTLLQYTQIVAPFDGVVTKRMIDKGALVQAATSNRTVLLFTVQRIDTVRIFVDVPETDVPGIKPGCAAKIKPYGMKTALDGKVTRIASSLNPATRTMRAEIDLPNPNGTLLHGMYAQVSLNVEETANAMTIPAAALLTEGKEQFVYTVADGQAVRRPVRTGLDNGLRLEIKDGLRDDEWVIVTGKALVAPGTAVTGVPRK